LLLKHACVKEMLKVIVKRTLRHWGYPPDIEAGHGPGVAAGGDAGGGIQCGV